MRPSRPSTRPAERSDEDLVRDAQAGDRAAMEELLRRHTPRLHAVCRRVIGSSRDADDALQETLIKIVRSLDRFDGRSSFTTWAHRIATNTALDELRRRRRRPPLHLVDDERDAPTHDPVDPLADRVVEAVTDRLAIDDALARLPEEFRLAVVLRDVADLDYAEIAAALDVPVGTVKSRIARGRAQLVEILGNRPAPDRRPTLDS